MYFVHTENTNHRCDLFRPEQPPEWPAQATHEGSVCGTVSYCTCEIKLSAALPANADGPISISLKWVPNPYQPGKPSVYFVEVRL